MRKITLPAALLAAAGLHAQPELSSWIINQGEQGQYYIQNNFTPQPGNDSANVKRVYYNASNVYLYCSGIPAYPTGPFLDGNPSLAGDANYLFRIPRTPQQNTGTLTATGLGQIGVFINGVPMYNYADAQSYNNQNIWHRNAVVAENGGFDCSKGHPAPNQQNLNESYYHHHQNPIAFNTALSSPASTICNSYPAASLYALDSTVHSPIIGYAFDGYPVYGSYAYANTNGTGGITRMRSSYRLRSITQRTTLPDGTVLQPSQYGPAINSTYPLGIYKEDFEYVQGLGDLDEHNGRVCVTPEYPSGIYCYFGTVDANWNSAYPYLIGPEYYGIVATDNFPQGPGGGTGVVMNGSVTQYTGSTGLLTDVLKKNFSFYPNPAGDYIDLVLQQQVSDLQVAITGVSGQLVREPEMLPAGVTRISLTDLAPGVYFLRMTMNGETQSKKLVIVR